MKGNASQTYRDGLKSEPVAKEGIVSAYLSGKAM